MLVSIKKDASIAKAIHESCYLRQARPNGQHVDLPRFIRQLLPHGFPHFTIFLIALQDVLIFIYSSQNQITSLNNLICKVWISFYAKQKSQPSWLAHLVNLIL